MTTTVAQNRKKVAGLKRDLLALKKQVSASKPKASKPKASKPRSKLNDDPIYALGGIAQDVIQAIRMLETGHRSRARVNIANVKRNIARIKV